MKIARLFLFAAVVLLGGCDNGGRERPPQTSIRAFNVAPHFESMFFYRERRLESNPTFMQAESLRFDSGPYDFRLEHLPISSGAPVIDEEFAFDLSGDLDYLFVFAAPNDEPETIVASWPKAFSSTTQARFSFVHANPLLANVDIYVAPPDSDLSATASQGSLGFRGSTTPFEVPAGPHRIYLTAAGNPADIIYESAAFEIRGEQQAFIVISDGDNRFIDDVILTDIFGSQPARIFAAGEASEVRVIQSIDDRIDRDVLIDQSSPALFPMLPFASVPDHVEIAPGSRELDVTPVGNAGAIEYTEEFTIVPNRQHTVLFAGDSSTGIDGAVLIEDARSIAGQATVWILNGAGLFNSLLVFITPPGTDLTTVDPTLVLDAPQISQRLRYVAQDFELTVIDTATGATLLGPEPLAFESGGVYQFLLVNSAGGSTVDLIRLDEPAGP
jgi:hypothetical protein